ncbi:MAG: proline--tRNA ligase [Planctomycetota bacterium]|jgi:prolyl-tRNA synthetase|nr:proline--tRNA ligase [Planctomycetota bacterium]
MRARTLNIVTLREDPADAEIVSHKLLTRAGYLHKSGAGLYLYGHFLKRVVDKISRIVAEEIAGAGGVEVTMPIMQERSLWERSGRWAGFQATRTMLTVTDRGGQEFGLSPTAEEVVTDYASNQITSYKQLPVCYFQQHTKFRDEIRPRFGLMRVKEFIMMDAYSFHGSEQSLDDTYQAMRQAYTTAFRRCGLEAFAVEADTGAIGGSSSHEFMIAADVGEDAILFHPDSGYAANVERAECAIPAAPAWSAPAAGTALPTPGAKTIDEVVTYLQANGYPDLTSANTLKAVLLVAETVDGDRTVAAFVRGDREVNEIKLSNAVSQRVGEVLQLRAMDEAAVRAATGCAPGFAGPGLNADVVVFDAVLDAEALVVAGANQDDTHAAVSIAAHLADAVQADITLAVAGDVAPAGSGELVERRGIEAGHIFKLGTKYSAAMGAEFTGEDGKRHPLTMGCYGIGTSRLAAAAVEQHNDKNGIVWPMSIAPYQVVVVPTRADDENLMGVAQQLYTELKAQGIEVILDDRDAKPGVKFKDWDLIGIPVKVVAGRGVADGNLEIKTRQGEGGDVAISDAVTHVVGLVRDAMAALRG